MQIKFGALKHINAMYITSSLGQFALEPDINKTISWDHCREQFLGKMNVDMKGFYFSHQSHKSEDVAIFLKTIEKILEINIEEISFSKFCKTDKDHIMWIEPSSFWMDCILKKSLLTLLLRVSLNFDKIKNNFDECIFGEYSENKLLKETKSAFVRFMFGFTKFDGVLPMAATNPTSNLIRHGWHGEFNYNDLAMVKRKLKSAKQKNYDNYFGFDFLWN